MTAAKEKNSLQFMARIVALLLLLAAIAAPAQARSAAENRAGEKSATNAALLLFQPLQLLEIHQVKTLLQRYDASGNTFTKKECNGGDYYPCNLTDQALRETPPA